MKLDYLFIHLFLKRLLCLFFWCMFRYSYNTIFWGPWTFCKNDQKWCRWLETYF